MAGGVQRGRGTHGCALLVSMETEERDKGILSQNLCQALKDL